MLNPALVDRLQGQVPKGNKKSSITNSSDQTYLNRRHLKQSVALAVVAEVRHRFGGRGQRPLDTERRELEVRGLHSGQQQRDGAAAVRAGHRGAVHQLEQIK